ncbi:MAG: ATP-binding protein [Candidatus Coatesbacteria bacterium]|nr:ATP-binding protein [Candidatus Coatesbacteria bacterium]
MHEFKNSSLWKNTLAIQRGNNPYDGIRERLRNAYLNFREKVKPVAAEIHRDLPEFTVHDITHIDALWGIVDTVSGEDYPINPAEAFVLGGAFLVHDLGMALATYPGRLDDLEKTVGWRDALAIELKAELGRAPTDDDFEQASHNAKRRATSTALREAHARQAETLVTEPIKAANGDEEFYLLEDSKLRECFGWQIGRIAHSHWWSIEELAGKLRGVCGAPAGFPCDWTIDELKLACILRAADAAHLDARRAPRILRLLRKLPIESAKHWIFQGKLSQPRRDSDYLRFTSSRPFLVTEAEAWWTCFDSLRMVDDELSQVDALLKEKKDGKRLAARRVEGVSDADRLRKYIPVKGWRPVDTRIRVTDVASLVVKLGGEQLYGDDKTVPLRELIQNAIDAVRARRVLEERDEKWGRIDVRLGKDEQGHWLEIQDNGIGMSERVLTGPFLDFGTSFWGSELMRAELSGLAGSGFESYGQYGIGFFSVFMLGEKVRVITRRYDAAAEKTVVLEFANGPNSRPLLRVADENEQGKVKDGGTCVRIYLDSPPKGDNGLLRIHSSETCWDIKQLCEWLCPAIEVDLYVNDSPSPVISALDWVEVEGADLVARIIGVPEHLRSSDCMGCLNKKARRIRLLRDSSDNIVGRACVFPEELQEYINVSGYPPGFRLGVVTVGGLRCNRINGIMGILIGKSTTVDRSAAEPIFNGEPLADWATEQAKLAAEENLSPGTLHNYAQTIVFLGGSPNELPITKHLRVGLVHTDWLKSARIWT